MLVSVTGITFKKKWNLTVIWKKQITLNKQNSLDKT